MTTRTPDADRFGVVLADYLSQIDRGEQPDRRAFIAAHPDTPQAKKAEKLLETVRFTIAKQKGTALALRSFLKDHPNGAHRDEADELLDELHPVSANVIHAADEGADVRRTRFGGEEPLRRTETEGHVGPNAFIGERPNGL